MNEAYWGISEREKCIMHRHKRMQNVGMEVYEWNLRYRGAANGASWSSIPFFMTN